MFLYYLNETEGKAFMELACLTIKKTNDQDWDKAEIDTYLTELNLTGFSPVGLAFEQAISAFKYSSVSVKRTVLIELCGLICSSKGLDDSGQKWIFSVAEELKVRQAEAQRLIQWSKDFSDFLEVGLMYINAKA